MRIPEQGWSKQQVIETLERFRAGDMPWRDGRTWAYVYDPGREAEAVIKRGLHDVPHARTRSTRPSSRARCGSRTRSSRWRPRTSRGDADVVGNFTSGGTESIILRGEGGARLRARDAAAGSASPRWCCPRRRTPRSTRPPTTSDVRPVLAPVDPKTFRADPRRRARRDHAEHDPARRLGGLVRARRRRPDPRARRSSRWSATCCSTSTAAWAASCCPYFRRLGAPVPRLRLPRARASPRSRWTSTSTRSPRRARRRSSTAARSCAAPDLRLRELDRLHGDQPDRAEHQVRRAASPRPGRCCTSSATTGYLEIARQVLDATRRIVAAIDAMPGPARARAARHEPDRVRLGHGERLPRRSTR